MRFLKIQTVLLALAIGAGVHSLEAQTPFNDDFANAAKLNPAGERVVSNNQFATMEESEPRHAGVETAVASLWWSFSPQADGSVLVDTTGSGFDTVIGVYTGTGLANLVEVASVDDVPNSLQGYLTFEAGAEVTYYIAVAGAGEGQVGEVRLRVEPGGLPDERPPDVVVTSHASGGTVFSNEIVLSGLASDEGANASGVAAVWVRVNDGTVSQLAEGTSNWSAQVLLRSGQNTIEVTAVDFGGNVSPPLTLMLRVREQAPANNFFANAILLEEETGTVTADTRGATKEAGEPNHAGNQGGRSVWWKWRAPAAGVLFLSTEGSNFDTLLGLYRGSDLGQLEVVASNDDTPFGGSFSELTTAVAGGELYYIAVDGFGGAGGEASLRYVFTDGTVHAVQIHAGTGGSVSPRSGYFPKQATVLLTATAAPYFEFAEWQGANGEWISYGNPFQLEVTGETSITARFVPRAFSDDFETGDWRRLAWESGGHAPWVVESVEAPHGFFAARSGRIGHGQHSSMILEEEMRAGTGSFEVRVSSEPNWDKLIFLVNGVQRGSWSGEVEWRLFTFPVPAGRNRLEWRYQKDPFGSAGLDAAFVNHVDLPLALGGGAPARVALLKAPLGWQVQVLGEPRREYVIEFSADLLNWQVLATQEANSIGLILFNDTESAGGATRFYRVLAP